MEKKLESDLDLSECSYEVADTKSFFLNKSIHITGKGRSGKTILARDIYHLLQDDIDHVYYITSKPDEPQVQVFPNVYNSRDDQIVNTVLESALESAFKTDGNKLVILDQANYKKLCRNNNYDCLINSNEYNNITTIIITNYVCDINPFWRDNVDIVFMERTRLYSEIQRLYRCYGGYFPSLNEFKSKITDLEQFEFMTCDNKYSGNDMDKRYNKYIANLYLDEEFRTDNCAKINFDDDLQKSLPDSESEYIVDENAHVSESLKEKIKKHNVDHEKEIYIFKELTLITDSLSELHNRVQKLQEYVWLKK